MPRSAAQSTQRYPLTTILGAEANVRLLRELHRHGGQLSAPSLVARTGLGKTSVWAALAALEGLHVVEAAGIRYMADWHPAMAGSQPCLVWIGKLWALDIVSAKDIMESGPWVCLTASVCQRASIYAPD